VDALQQPDLDSQIDDVVADLTREFGHTVGSETIRERVMEAYSRLSASRITTFVPVLTRRIARESLLQA
jgi:hypothetical protein